jgi:GNAT superfamily N-acetyltransferase
MPSAFSWPVFVPSALSGSGAGELGVRPHKQRMLNITKIAGPEAILDNTLKERAVRAHAGRSSEFIALVNGAEAGFLSYEDWSDQASAFVYEIFVLPPFRRRSIGSVLLSHAERHAIDLNCNRIRLKPHALDQEPSLSRLREWYASLGYKAITDDQEHMEKVLHGNRRLPEFCGH